LVAYRVKNRSTDRRDAHRSPVEPQEFDNIWTSLSAPIATGKMHQPRRFPLLIWCAAIFPAAKKKLPMNFKSPTSIAPACWAGAGLALPAAALPSPKRRDRPQEVHIAAPAFTLVDQAASVKYSRRKRKIVLVNFISPPVA
jgi:hypothetical protein